MSETEKKSKSNNQNAKFIQDIKRGDKEIDDIKPIIKYCTMSQELKMDTISRIKEAMSKLIYIYIILNIETTIENNSNYFKTLSKKIKINMDSNTGEIWNVIVGTDYGAWINFDKTYMLFLTMDELYFLIYRFGYDTK